MARMARVVVPGIAHHVTQRGNRRQTTFFGDADYAEYLRLLRRFSREASMAVWAYCLMPNHVHLVVVPAEAGSLHVALGEVHRRYSRHVNFREGWRGYLWQGRFASFPMDERHLLAAVRYVELNPVRAGLVDDPAQWRWSSAPARLRADASDEVLALDALSAMVEDWRAYLAEPQAMGIEETLRLHQRTGRPLGSSEFVAALERRTGRSLARKPPGPRPRTAD